MAWGWVLSHGPRDLVRVEGMMKKEQYKRILKQNTVLYGLKLIGNELVFQQHNDPKQFKIRRSCLEHKETEGVLWCGPFRARVLTLLRFFGKNLVAIFAIVVPPRKKTCGMLYKKTGTIFHKINRQIDCSYAETSEKSNKCKWGFFWRKICLKFERHFYREYLIFLYFLWFILDLCINKYFTY